jgi:hypothetical protein
MPQIPVDQGGNGLPASDTVDLARREALEKLAKLAVYTPPAMLTLLLSKRASAQSLGPPPPPPP